MSGPRGPLVPNRSIQAPQRRTTPPPLPFPPNFRTGDPTLSHDSGASASNQLVQTSMLDYIESKTPESHPELCTIMQLNIASLNQAKLPELLDLLETLHVDVLALQELSAVQHNFSPFPIAGFCDPIISRPDGSKGVAFYIRQGIMWRHKYVQISDDPQILHLRIVLNLHNGLEITVDNVYLHPLSSRLSRSCCFSDLLSSRSDLHLIIGDFNEPVGRAPASSEPSFLKATNDYDYVVLNDGCPTRIQLVENSFVCSSIDGTICSQELSSLVSSWEIIQSGPSDHLPIVTRLNVKLNCKASAPEIFKTCYKTLRRQFHTFYDEIDADPGQRFLQALYRLKHFHARQLKAYRPNSWWTPQLNMLKNERNKARKLRDKTRFLELKRKLRNAIRDAKASHRQRVLMQLADSNEPWRIIHREFSYLKKSKRSRSAASPEESLQTATEQANFLEDLFSSVESPPLDSFMSTTTGFDIARWEVTSALRTSKKASAAGPDRISYNHLSRLCEDERILTALIQAYRFWVSYGIPETLKAATVVAIPKATPGQFRPISLLNCTMKILERVVTQRLRRSYGHLIPSYQSGCLAGHSTADCILKLSHISARSVALANDGYDSVFGALFLDFKKAYDRVNHFTLLSKLQRLGINRRYLRFVADWLTNRHFTVLFNGMESSRRRICNGLPQGSSLSVLLWQLYISDLPVQASDPSSHSFDSDVHPAAFMDDICVFTAQDSAADLQQTLQQSLNKIQSWADANDILINPQKSGLLLNDRSLQVELSLSGSVLQPLESYKYLGIVLESRPGDREQLMYNFKSILSDLDRRISLLYRVRHRVPPRTLRMLAQSLVIGRMHYILPLISAERSTGLFHRLQLRLNKLMRCISGATRTTRISILQAYTAIPPIEILISKAIWSNLARILTNDNALGDWLVAYDGYAPALSPLGAYDDIYRSLPEDFRTLEISGYGHIADADMQVLTSVKFDIPASRKEALRTYELGKSFPGSTQLWTDGSVIEEYGTYSAAAGWIICCENSIFSQGNSRVLPVYSSYLAELAAFELGISELLNNLALIDMQEVGIFTDSRSLCSHLQAAILSSLSVPDNVLRITSSLARLCRISNSVTITWVPGHCQISFNEDADKQAELGHYSRRKHCMALTRSSFRSACRLESSQAFLQHLERFVGPSTVSQDYPSREEFKSPMDPKEYGWCSASSILFKIKTGHSNTRAHWNNVSRLSRNTVCRMCGECTETLDHLLRDCRQIPELTLLRHAMSACFPDHSSLNDIAKDDFIGQSLLIKANKLLRKRGLWV